MSRKTKNNHPAGQTPCISATVDFTVVFGSVVVVNGTKDVNRPKIVSGDSAAAGHGGVRVPLFSRHPGRRPGVHVHRLKVTGDIPSLPEGLPPARSDEHGFRIESGMTE
jgi:hypothetical protein